MVKPLLDIIRRNIWGSEGSLARAVVTKVALAAIVGVPLYFFNVLEWLTRRAVGIDKNGAILIDRWLTYGLTAVFLVLIGVVYVLAKEVSVRPREVELAEVLLDNARKLLDFVRRTDFEYEMCRYNFDIPADKKDLIKAEIKILNSGQPLSFIKVQHVSDSGYPDMPAIKCTADKGEVIALPTRNEKTRKEWLLYLHPPVEGQRTVTYEFVWENFWGTLRERNLDYYEHKSIVVTRRAEFEFTFPNNGGFVDWYSENIKWEEATTARVEASRQQRLKLEIDSPRLNQGYHYKIKRRP